MLKITANYNTKSSSNFNYVPSLSVMNIFIARNEFNDVLTILVAEVRNEFCTVTVLLRSRFLGIIAIISLLLPSIPHTDCSGAPLIYAY